MGISLDERSTKIENDYLYGNTSKLIEEYLSIDEENAKKISNYCHFILGETIKSMRLSYRTPDFMIYDISLNHGYELDKDNNNIVEVVDVFVQSDLGFYCVKLVPPHSMQENHVINDVESFIQNKYDEMDLSRDFQFINDDVYGDYVNDNQMDVFLRFHGKKFDLNRSEFIQICKELAELKKDINKVYHIRISARRKPSYNDYNPFFGQKSCRNIDSLIYNEETSRYFNIGISYDKKQ